MLVIFRWIGSGFFLYIMPYIYAQYTGFIQTVREFLVIYRQVGSEPEPGRGYGSGRLVGR